MNKAIIIGRLTKDVDLRVTASGLSVCSFTVAVDRKYAGQAGDRTADFIPVVCWRGLAENCGKYLRKGSKVCVLGAIQVRNYEATDGSRRYVTEIQADDVEFLDRAREAQPAPEPAYEQIGDDGEQLPF
ncbi:single-stranded DNA-binding protein [Eubacteriales bacterium OttesenSCG-928-M02]|nr:single-stranded DNA-binding protein [Eubacteriales bacterium OttesenSCG-928-M02]